MKPEALEFTNQNPDDAWLHELIQYEMLRTDGADPNACQLLDRGYWAKVYETYEARYKNPEQASLAVAKLITGSNIDFKASPPKIQITRAIQAFEYVAPYTNTEAGKPLYVLLHNTLLTSFSADIFADAPLINSRMLELNTNEQFDEYYKGDYSFKCTDVGFIHCTQFSELPGNNQPASGFGILTAAAIGLGIAFLANKLGFFKCSSKKLSTTENEQDNEDQMPAKVLSKNSK